MRISSFILLALVCLPGFPASVWGASSQALQERSAALAKDAEDMVAHGGMGDSKAIVHHAEAVIRHSEALLEALANDDTHSREVGASLRQAIAHARRILEMGPHHDPGALLNPAVKARRAVQEALKHLSRERGA